MNRCIICGRKMNDVNHVFGLSCLKRLCLSMNIMGVKNLKDEALLNSQVRKICDKKRLSQEQTRMLTNRYLTLNLLNEVQIDEYDKIREISFDLIKLAFSTYYNKKPYLSDMNQKLQHYVLNGGAIWLRLGNCMFAVNA